MYESYKKEDRITIWCVGTQDTEAQPGTKAAKNQKQKDTEEDKQASRRDTHKMR